ncbi:MAG TPA: hypothetical protein VF759_11320 [Allosphingosinicella sp.]|jgi:uncharacterized protein YcfL
MMKRFGFASVTALALAACSAEPEPVRADPALVERLALANVAEPESPKLETADKIVGAVDRVEPDRVAGAAEKLLAR